MSKQKSEAVAQLSLINFEDVDSIETEVVVETAPVQPVLVETETEEQVLATVESFESAFGNDPLKQDYYEWAMTIKTDVDSVDKAIQFVSYGAGSYRLMCKEKNIAPGSYERSRVIKKFESALRLCNVPEAWVKPQEITAIHGLVRLVRSTPGAEGEARSYPSDEASAEWFGGNITLSTLRVMAKCADRVSGKDEIDVWEFKDGYEAHVREWVTRLREGFLSLRQVESLIKYRAKVLAAEKKAAKFQGLSNEDIAKIEAAEKNRTLETKLSALGTKALELQDMAANELKKGKEELRDFLANKGVIPPAAFPTPTEIAARLTAGEAKALVQALIDLYPKQPDRLNVFKVLYNTTRTIVAQMKSAQEQPAMKKAV
jgi:hypothetical protein